MPGDRSMLGTAAPARDRDVEATRAGRFRADVQGLRGIAVLLVVAYHSGLPVPGGFVGVDVFFVISGYVITRLLLAGAEASGGVGFKRFYLRRIRRLLPALGLTLAVTMLLGIALAPIGAQQITARTGLSAALLNANTYLIRTGSDAGYFGVDASSNALLHTWSLSVEEQFYLAFPALLGVATHVARRRGRPPARMIGLLLGAIAAVSFALCVVLTTARLDPGGLGAQIAFYSAPTRAWEFAAGGLVAVAAPRVGRWRSRSGGREGAAAGGVALVAVAAFTFDSGTTFPGTAALLPVVGTALLLLAGEGRPARALGWAPLRMLGDLSYSWYLWHWPMIVFAGGLWPGSGRAQLAAGVGSLAPAWLSLRWVENPVRFRPHPRQRTTVALAGLCVAAPLVAAAGLAAAHVQLEDTALWEPFEKHADVLRQCDSTVPVAQRSAACRWTVTDPTGEATLVGDSNAGQFTEGFVSGANALGLDALVATRSACPFIDLLVIDGEGDTDPDVCRGFVEQSTADLVANPPEVVVIAVASDRYLTLDRYQIRSPDGSRVYVGLAERAAAWEAGLRRTVEALTEAGSAVLVVAPIPRLPEGWAPIEMAPARLIAPNLYDRSVSREVALRGRARAVEAERAATAGIARTLDVFDDLCPTARCKARDGGTWRYRDSDHLSVGASLGLADRFRLALDQALRR